jgi:hypothetical protein
MTAKSTFIAAVLFLSAHQVFSQAQPATKPKPEDTDIWSPEPTVITAGRTDREPPSDAIILFDGKNQNEWISSKDTTAPALWTIADGIWTVSKAAGNIQTKKTFTNYQLHIEWRIPSDISGDGQGRGNSGIFLASTGGGNAGYELQVLDSYHNKTYVNGMAGSIYKQAIPLVNVCRQPGEWQSYDVVWMAPVFKEDGMLASPARAIVFQNGVLVENNFELKGQTLNAGQPYYKKHGPCPIKLQAHGDKSNPISYRNIWVRPL